MDTNLLLKFNIDHYNGFIDKLLISNGGNSIYSGNCGALIYLISLYEISNDESVLKKIKQIEKVIDSDLKKSINSSYAYYTGNIGVAITYLRLYKLFDDETYLIKSLKIAKKSKNHISLTKKTIIDLINGVSGILLGLLHMVNSGIKDYWIYDDIKFYVDYIISKTQIYEFGIAWDKTSDINKCLTGFSHGSSGIGFVFNELYRITNISSFKKIAHLTFDYENQYFDKDYLNWLDFRKSPLDNDDKIKFVNNARNKNIDFFIRKKDMTAWCHGAPGILLSRLNSEYDEKHINTAILSIKKSLNNVTNHSICHSAVGNALCLISLLEKSLKIKDGIKKDVKKQVYDLCLKLITFYEANDSFISGYKKKYKNEDQSNYSLFMGETGTFYFLLKASLFLEDLPIGDNILYPSLKNVSISPYLKEKLSGYSNTNYTFKQLLKTKFAKTIYFLGDSINYNETLFKNENFEKKLTSNKNSLALDAFRYEKTYDKCDNMISYSYAYYKNIHVSEYLKMTNDTDLLKTGITLGEFEIANTLNDWNEQSNPLWSKNKIIEGKESTHYIIIPGWKVNIIKKTGFTDQVIEYLNIYKKSTIDELITYMIEQIEFEKSKIVEIRKLLLNNIKIFISKGIIIINNEDI